MEEKSEAGPKSKHFAGRHEKSASAGFRVCRTMTKAADDGFCAGNASKILPPVLSVDFAHDLVNHRVSPQVEMTNSSKQRKIERSSS